MSKFVKVPASIVLKNTFGMPFKEQVVTEQGETVTRDAERDFKSFLQERAMDKALTRGKTGFAAAVLQSELVQALAKTPSVGDYLELSYEQWSALVQTIKEPSEELDPRVAFCFVPFMQAVIEAADSAQLPTESK